MNRADESPVGDDFAAFRDRKRAARDEKPLEPSPRGPTARIAKGPATIAALIDGLEDTRAASRAEPPQAPAIIPGRVATSLACAEPPPADATRAFVREHALLGEQPAAPPPTVDDVDGSCSDPEFAKFRARRKPPSGSHRKPTARQRDGTPRSGVHRVTEPVEDRSSDPEFDKFRAEHKPASGSHRKTARHATAPLEPAPRGEVAVPSPDPTSMLAADRGGDPAFVRFRSPETPPPVAPAPPAPAPRAEEPPLFFGTNTQLRSTLRARVMGEREDETPSESESEAQRRRAPPPPLPERPRE